MFRRTMMRLGWPATAALTAVVVSLPAFAAADYSSHAAKAKRPAKAKALRGPRGLRGIQGPQGRAGTAGINGVGASGPAGAKGDKGEKGDQRTKVFNIAMAVGDADVTVLAYAPFTVVARCSATGPTVNADLLIKTITDDVYLDAPDGQPAPLAANAFSTSGTRTLARLFSDSGPMNL